MSKKNVVPYLISIIALLIASAALLLAGYNHYLIQEIFLELSRLNDLLIKFADINVQIGNVLQELVAEIARIWKAIQGILTVLGNLS